MRRLFCVYIFLISNFFIVAQDMAPDTILNLDDVTIYSSRISRFAKGQSFQIIDSLTRTEYPGGALSDLLAGSTSVYIRNYGQGTLSALSFRGTSSNHAGLLWNGIRVSPPNIGYLDLSLVQASYFNHISVLYGGASPMFGSGSIGGGIHLENRPVFEREGFETGLDLSGGSFGNKTMETRALVYRNKFYSRTTFTLNDAANDFTYTNLAGKREKLPHANIFKSGFIQDVAYQLPGNQYLMATAWFQYADRDIPPTLSEDQSVASQIDRSWRAMLVWKDFNDKYNLEAKLAYFNEFTRYNDPSAEVWSVIQSQSLVGAFESTCELGKNSAVFAGSQFTYEYADLDYYDDPKNQKTLALFASYRLNLPSLNWQLSLNGRQEFLSGFRSPFLFSAGMEGKIWRIISGRINISRNFRTPTLNERFWKPGGNTDLKPEESWNEEAGISLENQYAAANVKLSFTAFNSSVNNWILWLPGSSYWSVENAQKVWSRGVEVAGNQSFGLGQLSFYLAESYTFSKSTNQKKLFDLDASYKKQLIYTPLHRMIIKTGVIYRGFNLALKGNLAGEVFSTKDNTESLPSYFLLDAVISKSFTIKKDYPLILQLNLNNILNADYQAIPYRPMPGFGFLITIRTELKIIH